MKVRIALIDCFAAEHSEPVQRDYPSATVVYTGPTVCCCNTAGGLYPRIPVIMMNNLRRFEFGVFAGKGLQELAGDRAFQEWEAAGSAEPCPQGESACDFAARCARAFRTVVEEMCSKGIEETAMVVHEMVMGAILRRYCMPRSLYRDWRTSPGGGYEVEYDSILHTAKILSVI